MRDIKKVFDKCDKYLDNLIIDGGLNLGEENPNNNLDDPAAIENDNAENSGKGGPRGY